MNSEEINQLIKINNPDTNLISDGYHTFGELYEHRIILFITLCRIIQDRTLKRVWRYRTDKDWFLLGINTHKGHQITYHLPISKWEICNFATTPNSKPEWDGHTPSDVLQRLSNMI